MWTPNKYLLLVLLNLLLKARGDPLLVSLRNGIWLLEGNQTSSVVSSDLAVVTFDVHQAWRQLYWATQHSIYRTPLYDRQTTTLVAVVGQVGSLAVDWIHNDLYWSDLSASRIEAARLDGRDRRIVYERKWHIGSLALDPELGKLFWFESNPENGKEKLIKTSNFDGSHVKILYTDENIYGETPLTLDLVYNCLYFYKVNGSLSEQWEISYNGVMIPIKLFEREEAPARSLSLTENGFYYCNEDGIFEANWVKKMITLVFGERVETVTVLDPYFRAVPETLTGVSHLRVLSETGSLRKRDACSYQQCQQQCVPIKRGTLTSTTRCLCHYGYSLNNDNRTCSGYGYLLYSTSTTFGRLNLDGKQHTVLFNDPYSEIQTFDVHLKTGFVYWSDVLSQTIYRAPAELPIKKEIVVPKVSAYGVAVDWLHDHLYWTDFNRILVSTLTGDQTLVLLKDLNAPAEIVVDPVNRYIFWAECGQSLSIKRAGLDGSDVTTIVSHVTCGTSITADPKSRTVYLRYWTGSVYSCSFDGSNKSLFLREMVGAMTILDQRLLWTSTQMRTVGTNDSSSHSQLSFLGQVVQPAALKVMKGSQQTGDVDECVDSDCPGMCLLSPNQTVPALCVCTDHDHNAVPCSHAHNTSTRNEGHPQGYLEVVESESFSVTLRCAGPLLTHPVIMPFLQVAEVDSLVARHNVTRMSRQVRVTNKTLPFTIDSLNPATSYKVTVRNRVTRASVSLTVHTAPPPLAVRRLPLVTVPGLNKTVPWLQQGIHFFSPNAWEQLLHREHLLLLVSEKQHTQADSPAVPEPLLRVLQKKVKSNFIILSHYKTEEEFDDDPEMYLGNIPWGEEFWLAMVQVTEYKQTYNLDVVYSKSFGLPDPYWDFLLGQILEEQREEED